MTRDAEHTPSPQSVVVDTFSGDNAALVRSIAALLTMKNLTPPVPGLARQLLATSAARLAATPAPSSLAGGEWRPMKDAPADGTKIIGRNADGDVFRMWWHHFDADNVSDWQDDNDSEVTPIGWVPYPSKIAALSPEAPARAEDKS